jgi:hypothetical protein
LFHEIEEKVDSRFSKRQPYVERLKTLVEKCLSDLNINGRVYGRRKHIYSIYKKMQEHSLDNIYDLIAVRALVQTVPECYALLGRLHSLVEPYKNRFKDYISTPKPNGYQSLHTTVLFEGLPVEIQIRTEEMHQYAEYGVAANTLFLASSYEDLYGAEAAGMWCPSSPTFPQYNVVATDATSGKIVLTATDWRGNVEELGVIAYSKLTATSCEFDLGAMVYPGEGKTFVTTAKLMETAITVTLQ